MMHVPQSHSVGDSADQSRFHFALGRTSLNIIIGLTEIGVPTVLLSEDEQFLRDPCGEQKGRQCT